jgi:hypothetical protein
MNKPYLTAEEIEAGAMKAIAKKAKDAPRPANGNGHARPAKEPFGSPPEMPVHILAFTKGLKIMNAEELLKAQFPQRGQILAPWLPEQGLAMIFAPRGVGKTWIALGASHIVAGGGQFLKWKAPRPRRVLYIDGEMPSVLLRNRYAEIVRSLGTDIDPENFKLVAADFQPDGLPDLSNLDAQRYYDRVIADADLIVVDNLSTIARGLRENEADSYAPLQSWLLAQRAAGRSVLLVHHAGKGGQQRGTSRKEDVLDSVISLQRPPGYAASEGARFEVRFTKSRGFFGDDAESFEARFSGGIWSISDITADDSDEGINALHVDGLSIRDIADRTGLSKSDVGRRLKKERPE